LSLPINVVITHTITAGCENANKWQKTMHECRFHSLNYMPASSNTGGAGGSLRPERVTH
jgi:hypothetical protein